MPVVRISDESMKRLEAWADPLEDTLAPAFARVLDAAESLIHARPRIQAPVDGNPLRHGRRRSRARIEAGFPEAHGSSPAARRSRPRRTGRHGQMVEQSVSGAKRLEEGRISSRRFETGHVGIVGEGSDAGRSLARGRGRRRRFRRPEFQASFDRTMTGLVNTGVVSEPGKNCGADAMASFGAPRPASLSKAVPFAPPTGIQRRRR